LAQSIVLRGIDTSGTNTSSLVQVLQQTPYSDSLHWKPILTAVMDSIWWQGYLAAGIDSSELKRDTLVFHFFQGKKYIIQKIYIKPFLKREFPDSITVLQADGMKILHALRSRMIREAEAVGYPFAAVHVYPKFLNGDSLNVEMELLPLKKITMGGVHVVGNLKVKEDYIERIIGFEKGKDYSPGYIEQAGKKIREIGFVDQYRAPVVVFAENKAYLVLFLNKKNTDRLDVLIGFQPDDQQIAGVRSRVILTGNALIELINKLGNGERILMEFIRPSRDRQQIRVESDYPFVFNSPFSINGFFKLFKADTSFLETNFQLGTQYYFNYYNKLNVYWNRSISDLKSIDEHTIILTKRLPKILDIKTDFYGLDLNITRLDFRPNPRRGLQASLRSGIGVRQINKNPAITSLTDPMNTEFDFNRLYDTVEKKKIIYKPEYDLRLFIPVSKRVTIMTRTLGAALVGAKTIYNNEKFRLGGISNLRGFNEQSILGSMFFQGTIEPRLLLDDLSALYIFCDNAWINYNESKFNQLRWHMSVGAGINFGTRIGVFTLNAAAGKARGEKLDLRATKIHFGYLSIF